MFFTGEIYLDHARLQEQEEKQAVRVMSMHNDSVHRVAAGGSSTNRNPPAATPVQRLVILCSFPITLSLSQRQQLIKVTIHSTAVGTRDRNVVLFNLLDSNRSEKRRTQMRPSDIRSLHNSLLGKRVSRVVAINVSQGIEDK